MFRPGDMVVLIDRWISDPIIVDLRRTCPGVVIEVDPWQDSGDPDRNFGVNVHVLWSDSGEVEIVDEYDIDHYRTSQQNGNQTYRKGLNSPTE